jgi:hypothetical protein
MLRIGLIQAGVAAIGMVVLNILQVHEMWLVMLVISVSIASNSFTSSNINGLAMQEHGERAGVAAGLIGFTGSIFGAMAASLTGPLFGLTAMGMLSFMAILLLSGSTLGLVGLRNEAPLKH